MAVDINHVEHKQRDQGSKLSAQDLSLSDAAKYQE